MLRQIGVEGIVTALHEVPNGEIWTVEAINDLKSYPCYIVNSGWWLVYSIVGVLVPLWINYLYQRIKKLRIDK